MKKFIIGMTGIALCLCLTACGKSSTPSSVSNLSNQLDETANALSSISAVSPTDIGISSTNKTDELYINSQLTQQSLLNEQYYKTEILDRTATLKNNLCEVSLSKMQKSAINDLTNTLNKYTSAIQNSKYEMNSSAKAISSMKKNTTKNEEKLKAKYNRLACNSNMRSAYYENILNTLDEIENCLNLNCQDCTPTPTQEQNVEQKDDTQTQPTIKKNIDTYQNEDKEQSETENLPQEDILPPSYNRKRKYYNPNRYNTVYNRFNRFNPSRNTDTYGPNRRNIDSFGGYGFNNFGGMGNGMSNPYGMAPYGNGYGYGNNGYGYGNNFYAGSNYGNRLTSPMPATLPATYASAEKEPEQRLETFEKTASDNTVEKLEEKEDSKILNENNGCVAAISASTIARKPSVEDIASEYLNKKIVAHQN